MRARHAGTPMPNCRRAPSRARGSLLLCAICSKCTWPITRYRLKISGSRGPSRIDCSSKGIVSSIAPVTSLQTASWKNALDELRLDVITISNSGMASSQRPSARNNWPFTKCASVLRGEVANTCSTSAFARATSAAREFVIPANTRTRERRR